HAQQAQDSLMDPAGRPEVGRTVLWRVVVRAHADSFSSVNALRYARRSRSAPVAADRREIRRRTQHREGDRELRPAALPGTPEEPCTRGCGGATAADFVVAMPVPEARKLQHARIAAKRVLGRTSMAQRSANGTTTVQAPLKPQAITCGPRASALSSDPEGCPQGFFSVPG